MAILETDISHLTIVYKFGPNVLLFIKNEDILEYDPATLMYNLMFKSFHIGRLQRMLRLADFEKIDTNDENLQNSYRNQVYGIMPQAKLSKSNTEFRVI